MVRMGDDSVFRVEAAHVVWARLDIDEVAAGRADHEIGRAGARRVGHRPRRLIKSLHIEHLAAAYMERLLIGIAAVVARGETVFDHADPAFVDPHFSAGDPSLGEADETRLPLSPRAQHEGAAMHAFEPVPVLPEPGVAIGGRLGQEAERGAAVEAEFEQLSLRRALLCLLAEQREGELVARIEQRDGVFALPAAVGNSPHLLGIGAIVRGDRLAPSAGLNEGFVPIKARGGEAAQIRRDIVGDFLRKPPAMGETARVRVALGCQQRDGGHESSHRRQAGCLFGEPRDLGAMVADIVLEPEREGVRVARDAPADIVERQVRDVGDLGGAGPGRGLEPPEIDVDEFVLVHAVAERGLVAREKTERQRARHPEFLAEPPARRRGGAFAGTRMAATGIRPQSARVIFVRTALLDHDAPARVHDEDRKRAMQEPGAMNRGFARRAGGAVAFVDQNQLLLGRVAHHGLFACRKSFTRTALPCERGTSPGALSTTSQVTPTIALMCWRTSAAILAANGASRGAGLASSTSIVTASMGPSRVSTSW